MMAFDPKAIAKDTLNRPISRNGEVDFDLLEAAIVSAINDALAALPPPEGDVGERLRAYATATRNVTSPTNPGAILMDEAADALSRQLPAPTGEVVAWRVGQWGNGSQAESGLVNIFCDEWETTIAEDMPRAAAEAVVEAHNSLYASPAGWVLVPVVPTDAMIRAGNAVLVVGYKENDFGNGYSVTDLKKAYAAMLAAAPQSPMGEGTVGVKPHGVYLAARYSRAPELRAVRDDLLALGYTITSRWIDGGHELTKEGSTQADEAERTRFATEDEADCMAADIVISFTEEPRKTTTRGGRHVEFGMARASGKRLVVIGHRENVFHCLDGVEFYPSWKEARAALSPSLQGNGKGAGLKLAGHLTD